MDRLRLRHRLPSLLLGACLALPAVHPAATVDDDWIRVRTAHFILYGNSDPQRAVDIAGHLERLRGLLPRIFPGREPDSSMPVSIYLFRDQDSFRPYKQARDAGHDSVRGYFVRARDGNYLAMNAATGPVPFGIISHEYLHFFLDNRFFGIPLWLNEGLAEVFSTVRFNSGVAEIGLPIEGHLAWLAEHPLIPIERFLAAGTDSPEYRDGTERRTFYAQAWLVTHDLLIGGGAGAGGRLQDYLDLVYRLPVPADAFFAAFQTDPDRLRERLLAYRKRESWDILRVESPAGDGAAAPEVGDLPRGEVLFRLGDLLAHHNEGVPFRRAEDLLREALKAGGPPSAIHVSLGYLAQRRDRTREAADQFETAIRLDPRDARGLALYGWLLLKGAAGDGAPAGTEAEDVIERVLRARELFRRSLDLNPDDPETLAGFGKTFLFDPEGAAEGIRALERAREFLPTRLDLLRDRIALLAAAGDIDQARALLESELRPRAPDEDTIRDAEEAVVNAGIRRAIDLHNAGDPDGALAGLERLEEQTRDPKLLVRIGDARRTLIRSSRTRDETDLFNLAVEAANRQDLEEALQLFERVLAEAESPELRDAAAVNIDDLRTVLHNNRLVERFNQAVELVNSGRADRALPILEEILRSDPDPGLRARVEDAVERVRRMLGRP